MYRLGIQSRVHTGRLPINFFFHWLSILFAFLEIQAIINVTVIASFPKGGEWSFKKKGFLERVLLSDFCGMTSQCLSFFCKANRNWLTGENHSHHKILNLPFYAPITQIKTVLPIN